MCYTSRITFFPQEKGKREKGKTPENIWSEPFLVFSQASREKRGTGCRVRPFLSLFIRNGMRLLCLCPCPCWPCPYPRPRVGALGHDRGLFGFVGVVWLAAAELDGVGSAKAAAVPVAVSETCSLSICCF